VSHGCEVLLGSAPAEPRPCSAASTSGPVSSITVEKPDYQPWARTGVVANRGQCGVITVDLIANLEPIPES
jgi:hypothetical protein